MKVDLHLVNNTKIPQYKLQKFAMSNPYTAENREFLNIGQVSFQGIERPLLRKSLENLNNIHCPTCGVKMLTQKGFEELMLSAENISSKDGLLRFLNVNIEYIDKSIQDLVKLMNKFSKEKPNIGLDELLLITQKSIDKNFETLVTKQISKLADFKDANISAADRQIFSECAQKIRDAHLKDDKGISNGIHKEILKNAASSMENPDKWNIYKNLRKEFTSIYEKKLMLKYSLMNNRDLPQNIAKNIFKRSISQVNKINDNIPYDNNSNLIILCNNCSKQKTSIISDLMCTTDETHLMYYNRYLEDIAKKLVDKETDLNTSYIFEFNTKMKRLSKGKLFISGGNIISKFRHQHFMERNSGIVFNLTEKEGIPCACCGNQTLTHAKKVEMLDSIKNAKDKNEIVKILSENLDIVHEGYKQIVDEFINIIKNNPKIADKEVINLLKISSSEKIKSQLEKNNIYVKNAIKHAQLSRQDQDLANEYIKGINEKFLTLPSATLFPWYDYVNLLNSTINKMESTNVYKYYHHLKRNIKNLVSPEFVIYPIDAVTKKYDSPLKVVVQNIFRDSVATKDHVVAKAISGGDEQKNLLVLCKYCNREKGTTKFFNWLRHDRNIIKNIEKYFKVIDEKIRTGEIEPEYRNYLKELQLNIYELTHGRFDIDYSPNL